MVIHRQTYAIRSPLATHFRKATCEEVDCSAWRNGWTLLIDGLSADLYYTATHSGRKYREVLITASEVMAPLYPTAGRYLVFEAHQPCFASNSHRVTLERPAFYFVGRHPKQQPLQIARARQLNDVDFVDHMQEHLDHIREEIERG